MSTSTKHITDQELQNQLEESHLTFEQKLHFMPIIPVMTQKDKDHLIHLIKRVNRLDEKQINSVQKYYKELSKVNEEYERKMDELVQGATKLALSDHEKKDKKHQNEALDDLENLMQNI